MCAGPWQYTFVNVCLSEIQSRGGVGGQNPPTKNEGATVNYVKFLGVGGCEEFLNVLPCHVTETPSIKYSEAL